MFSLFYDFITAKLKFIYFLSHTINTRRCFSVVTHFCYGCYIQIKAQAPRTSEKLNNFLTQFSQRVVIFFFIAIFPHSQINCTVILKSDSFVIFLKAFLPHLRSLHNEYMVIVFCD
uniref:Uncharacterized protein n=1 Tax=Lutzomyia longipalpis TaxID=7200 RepID=A0A1B0CKR7_LUTLO